MKTVFRSYVLVDRVNVYLGWILLPERAENLIILMLGDSWPKPFLSSLLQHVPYIKKSNLSKFPL